MAAAGRRLNRVSPMSSPAVVACLLEFDLGITAGVHDPVSHY